MESIKSKRMSSTMMNRMEEFCRKYSIDESGKEEMLKIMNESMVLISVEILKSVKLEKVEKAEKLEKSKGIKRYKSKKAEEYALEHGIEIDEFEIMEISKKDVENLVREKNKITNKSEKKETNTSENKNEVVKKDRVICCGINKKGEACKSTGTIKPEGAKRHYCFRHAEDWKSFECESDSSDEELEKEELENEENELFERSEE